MKKSLFKATAALGLAIIALAMNAHAHQENGSKGMGGMQMDCMGNSAGKDSSKAPSMSDGEVKAVDKAGKSITLKHGRIKSKTVEMGPMTMPFPVQDAALLSSVKVGDKVKFNVENIKDVATVTSLKVQK